MPKRSLEQGRKGEKGDEFEEEYSVDDMRRSAHCCAICLWICYNISFSKFYRLSFKVSIFLR
jgi:hypothetical protein